MWSDWLRIDERRIVLKTLGRILFLATTLLGILFFDQPIYAPQPVHAQNSACAPYGDPIRSTGAYYVCTENKYRIGMFNYDELRITCKENTAHPGMQWHLWAQPDESRAGCNKHDVEAGMSTCCGRTAAAHCTDKDPGAPGHNGCATWNDEGH